MKRSELLQRVRFVVQEKKRILRFDFSGLAATETLAVMDYGTRFIARMPPNSVLTLTNIAGADYDQTVTDALKKFTEHNKPYVIAGAVVGVAGLKKVIYHAVIRGTGRTNLKLFATETGAREWLANY